MPDVAKALIARPELLREDDFLPLPCAHPNCHLMTYLWRGGVLRPCPSTASLMSARTSISWPTASSTRPSGHARSSRTEMLEVRRRWGVWPGLGGTRNRYPGSSTRRWPISSPVRTPSASRSHRSSMPIRSMPCWVMKCCLAHVLPMGHIVPFCAYNTLYRDGHVPRRPSLTRRPPSSPGPARDRCHSGSHPMDDESDADLRSPSRNAAGVRSSRTRSSGRRSPATGGSPARAGRAVRQRSCRGRRDSQCQSRGAARLCTSHSNRAAISEDAAVRGCGDRRGSCGVVVSATVTRFRRSPAGV